MEKIVKFPSKLDVFHVKPKYKAYDAENYNLQFNKKQDSRQIAYLIGRFSR